MIFVLGAFTRRRAMARLDAVNHNLRMSERWGYQHTRFYGHVRKAGLSMRVAERLQNAEKLPFTMHDSPKKPAEIVALGIAVMAYLAKKYPKQCNLHVLNKFLQFCQSWQLPSFKTIFRRHLNHEEPRTVDGTAVITNGTQNTSTAEVAIDEGRLHRNGQWKEPPIWYHPLPEMPKEFNSLLVPLPVPDKTTFVTAMHLACTRRDLTFAREVWSKRQSWLARIHHIVSQRCEAAGYDDRGRDMELLETERWFTRSRKGWTAREWSSGIKTDGASFNLYEGYVRLKYIEILAACAQWEEAFQLIMDGTGEKYSWSEGMLGTVRESAVRRKNPDLVNYIDSLGASQRQLANPERWYNAVVDDVLSNYEDDYD